MATEARPPVVSINMPCYRQLAHARCCVEAILAQTFTDFELLLIDDGASEEYSAYVAALGDPRVRYCHNAVRLGAMQNMFAATAAGRGRFTLAFHEDDLMSRGFLAAAVGVLDSHPDCGFVAGELREFRGQAPPAGLDAVCAHPAFEMFASPADFVRGVLRGIEPMFGSVLYRRAALADARAEHEQFATLVDRPFLLSMLPHWQGAVIREPLVWYRAAPDDDRRHDAMRTEHIIALLSAYKAALPQPLSPRDQALFYTYSGYWLFRLYDLTPVEGRPPFASFLFRVWRDGLYQAKWRGRFGLRLIARALTPAS